MSADGFDDGARRTASIDWFHSLAELGRDEIARRFSPVNLARLQAHVQLCLAGAELPWIGSPEQFAETVLDLRANESEWTRATMSATTRPTRPKPNTTVRPATISPANSWPVTSGTGTVRAAHSSQFQIWMSVPQIPVLRMRISTSSGPISGTGRRSIHSPGSGIVKLQC